jgi:hypothetical protein
VADQPPEARGGREPVEANSAIALTIVPVNDILDAVTCPRAAGTPAGANLPLRAKGIPDLATHRVYGRARPAGGHEAPPNRGVPARVNGVSYGDRFDGGCPGWRSGASTERRSRGQRSANSAGSGGDATRPAAGARPPLPRISTRPTASRAAAVASERTTRGG